MRHAARASLSLLGLALGLLVACIRSGGGGGSRPGVMPLLSELPGDPAKRDAVLDQSGQTAGPEQRKTLTRKERKAETTAATAAAIIGGMFSKTQNVTLGTASTFDENQLAPTPIAPPHPAPLVGEGTGSAAGSAAAPVAETPLVPWINLKK